MENEEFKPVLPKSLYDRIEEDVVNLHIELELEIPVDPHKVVKALGFIVRRFSEITDPSVWDMLKTAPYESRDGLSYHDPGLNTYVIWVNDLETIYAPRLKFTIMHEVGHIRMGHRTDSPLAETIANYYAAYALVPSPLPGMLKCNSYLDIMDKFNVSPDCAYNCSRRYTNWLLYGGKHKPYEIRLMNYYKKQLNID